MTEALEKGIPKIRIEESSTRIQAKIDSGERTVVGINKFTLSANEEEKIDHLVVDNSMVLQNQIGRINEIKNTRSNKNVEKKLEKLTSGASENGNVLELAIDAAREGATVGEISTAMEKVWKRHKAKINLVKDIYGENFNSDSINSVRKRVKDFEIRENRKPKIYIAKLGQDGHDRGQKL